MSIELPRVIAKHVAAVNAFDVAGIIATFADDAFVNDARREFWGVEQIRGWVEREIVGDRVQMKPRELMTHHRLIVLRADYDGDFDKTNLPPELILTNYITLRDDKIDTLIIIRNEAGHQATGESGSEGLG